MQSLSSAPSMIVMPAYIYLDKRLSMEERLIWAAVVGLGNSDENAWEDHPLLQRIINADIPIVRKCLDHLVELGFLLFDKEGVRTHFYAKSNALMWHKVEL